MAPCVRTRTRRFLEYDYLRVVAILAVVAIHVAAPHLNYTASIGADSGLRSVTRWLLYAVPALVFISGALVWGKRESMGMRGYDTFLKRRLAVVGVPYLTWTIVYFGLNQVLDLGVQAHGARSALRLFVLDLLSGGASYHLYFVPVLMVLYALTPVARWMVRRSPEAVLVIGISVSLWGYRVAGIVAAASHHAQDFSFPLAMLVQLAPYMALGAWYAVRKTGVDRVLRRIWWVLLSAGAWVRVIDWASLGLAEPVRLVIATAAGCLIVLGLVGGFRLLPGRNARSDAWALSLSVLAYGVYLAHPFVILCGRLVIGRYQAWSLWGGVPFTVGVYLLVVTLTFALVALLRRVPLLHWATCGEVSTGAVAGKR